MQQACIPQSKSFKPILSWRETFACRHNAERAVTPTMVCLTPSFLYQLSYREKTHSQWSRVIRDMSTFILVVVFLFFLQNIDAFSDLCHFTAKHERHQSTHHGLTGQSHATPAKPRDYFSTAVQENSSWDTPSLRHLAKISWAWGRSTNGRAGSNSPSALTAAWASVAHTTFLLCLHCRQNGDKQQGCNSCGV